jgi:hypothetical protein
MPERALTAEELAALPPEVRQAMGLTAKAERVASPEEIAAAGLEAPQPVQPRLPPGFFKNLIQQYGAGALKQGLDEAAGEIVQHAPGTSPTNETYRKARDAVRSDLAAGSTEYPVSSFLANVAGDVSSDALLKRAGLPVLSTGYQAAAGGLSGLLGGEAELTSDKRTTGDVARAGIDAGVGATLGAVVPKVAQGAGRVMGPLLRKARAGLEAGAVGLGRRVLQGGSDLAGARFKEVPAEAILEALRSGAIVPMGTTGGAFKRLERMASERGAGYAALLQDLEDMGFKGPEVAPLVESLLSRADEMARNTITSGAPAGVLRRAGENLDDIARGGRNMAGPPVDSIPLTQADEIKRAAQSEAKYGLLSDTPVNESKKEVASQVRQAIEDAIETQGAQFPADSIERAQAEAFVPVKRQLARTIAARNLAEKGNTRVSGRNAVGLREALMGAMLSGGGVAAGGAPVESLIGGLGTAAALSMAGRRLPSTGASALYQGSKAARSLADAAARNPQTAGLPVAKGAADLSREQLSALIDYLEGPRRKKEKKQ